MSTDTLQIEVHAAVLGTTWRPGIPSIFLLTYWGRSQVPGRWIFPISGATFDLLGKLLLPSHRRPVKQTGDVGRFHFIFGGSIECFVFLPRLASAGLFTFSVKMKRRNATREWAGEVLWTVRTSHVA